MNNGERDPSEDFEIVDLDRIHIGLEFKILCMFDQHGDNVYENDDTDSNGFVTIMVLISGFIYVDYHQMYQELVLNIQLKYWNWILGTNVSLLPLIEPETAD